MPFVINSKSKLPSMDELMKPLAYLRDREDKFEQQWAESDARTSMYKQYIDNIRQTSPDHALVKNFDAIQNELNGISDNLTGSAIDPNFSKRLYKVSSMFNQFAVPFEEAKQRYQKYNETVAQLGPDFVYDSSSNPVNMGIHTFYDNPQLVAPKGVRGSELAKLVEGVFSPIAQGVTSLNTQSQGALMKIITKQGFSPEATNKIIEAMSTNKPDVINQIPGITKEVADLIKYGINSSRDILTGLGITENDPNYFNSAMNWVKQGIVSGSTQKIKQDIQGNPYFKTTAQQIQEDMIINDYNLQGAQYSTIIDDYNKTNPNNKINKNQNGYIDWKNNSRENIDNFYKWNYTRANNGNSIPLKGQKNQQNTKNINPLNTTGKYTEWDEKNVGDPTYNLPLVYTYTNDVQFKRIDSQSVKGLNPDIFLQIKDNILNKYLKGGGVQTFGTNGFVLGQDVWYVRQNADDMYVRSLFVDGSNSNHKISTHRNIPAYSIPPTQITSKGEVPLVYGQIKFSDAPEGNTFDPNSIFEISKPVEIGLPKLSEEEAKEYKYIGIPKRNTDPSTIGDSYSKNKYSDYIVIKVKKAELPQSN